MPRFDETRFPCVYILASKKNGTIYIGVTSDLASRMIEHQSGKGSEFTSRYGVYTLVWFEEHETMMDAIAQEKRLKKYPRQWKINLIEESNQDWLPLHPIDGHVLTE